MRYLARKSLPDGRGSDRRAFSLMEMVLALAIVMVLLAALYTTLNMQYLQTQAGRDVTAQGVVVRSILTRMVNDIGGQVGASDPRIQQSSAANNNSANSSASTTAPATGTTAPAASGTASGTSTSSSTTTDTSANPVTFNVGVQGQDKYLTVSVYRPQPPTGATNTTGNNAEVVSDLRVIAYWLVTSGDKQGLARKEFRQATNADINTIPTQLADANNCVIAEEVADVLFEYYDGTTWQATWDGTQVETPGTPPLGPPVAVRVTLTLKNTKAGAGSNPDSPGPTYQQVIALPTGNFVNQQPTTSP